jgi:alcohol dehydrogenase
MKTKAAILYKTGLPRPYTESMPLKVEETNLTGPGPGEVLVKIAAAGICHSDLSVIDGSRPRPTPMVIGHEASGVVIETGPGANGFFEGDHVVFSFVPACGRCSYCLSGRSALCEPGAKANLDGTLLGGERRFADTRLQPCNHHLGVSAFSEFTVAAQESLVKIDRDLPLTTAALFGCAVLTGVGAVLNTAQVTPGRSVAVFGLGGVGLSVVIGAKAAGAYPIIVVDQFEEKLKLAAELGATHTINIGQQEPVDAVRELSRGGAEFTFESVGSEKVLMQAYRSTRRGGTTVTMGLPHPEKMFSVPAASITAEERSIKGSYMGSCVPSRDIPRFIEMHKAGLLPVDKLCTNTLELEEINAGFERLASGDAIRQIVSFK